MYLPNEIPNARVLIAVKTYPNPSAKYDELVCNAGFLESGEWIRIYPIRFRRLPDEQQYSKYNWIELDLVRQKKDFRRESYTPRRGIEEEIEIVSHIGTGKNRDWQARKRFALDEVFTSINELIDLAKKPNIRKSLGTIKPKELIKFEIVENEERDWKPKMKEQLKQMSLFADKQSTSGRELEVVRKLPYRYYYHFRTDDNENKPRRLMIEDWEIGALYWNCLAKTEGDEHAANKLVRKTYEEKFFQKDLHLFVGTTKRHHNTAPNPFVIIGVFPPPYTPQLSFDF